MKNREYIFTSPWIDENEEDSRTHRIVAYRRPFSPFGENRRYVTHMEFQDGDCLSGHYDLTFDDAIADAVERYARTGHQARLEYLRSREEVRQ